MTEKIIENTEEENNSMVEENKPEENPTLCVGLPPIEMLPEYVLGIHGEITAETEGSVIEEIILYKKEPESSD